MCRKDNSESMGKQVNSYCQWAGVEINMGKTEVTGYDYKRQCPLDVSILQLGNCKPKIVMPWDPVKYLEVRLTITGDLTFERDYVREKLSTPSSSWPSTCTTLRLSARSGLSTNPHKFAFRPMTIFWRYFHTSIFTSRRDDLKILGFPVTLGPDFFCQKWTRYLWRTTGQLEPYSNPSTQLTVTFRPPLL